MKKWFAFIAAVVFFFFVHEGLHALTASFFGEYQAFHVRPLGLEVTFKTPVPERAGWHWALISGPAAWPLSCWAISCWALEKGSISWITAPSRRLYTT